jgi:hypothetical protein
VQYGRFSAARKQPRTFITRPNPLGSNSARDTSLTYARTDASIYIYIAPQERERKKELVPCLFSQPQTHTPKYPSRTHSLRANKLYMLLTKGSAWTECILAKVSWSKEFLFILNLDPFLTSANFSACETLTIDYFFYASDCAQTMISSRIMKMESFETHIKSSLTV